MKKTTILNNRFILSHDADKPRKQTESLFQKLRFDWTAARKKFSVPASSREEERTNSDAAQPLDRLGPRPKNELIEEAKTLGDEKRRRELARKVETALASPPVDATDEFAKIMQSPGDYDMKHLAFRGAVLPASVKGHDADVTAEFVVLTHRTAKGPRNPPTTLVLHLPSDFARRLLQRAPSAWPSSADSNGKAVEAWPATLVVVVAVTTGSDTPMVGERIDVFDGPDHSGPVTLSAALIADTSSSQ